MTLKGLVLLGSVVMLQSYDDISLLAPGIDVAVSLGDLLERIAPIDNGFEFSRLRHPVAGQRRERAQHVVDDSNAAMNLVFDNIFAGEAVRRAKGEHQRMIHRLSVQLQQMGLTRHKILTACQRMQARKRCRPGHAHNRDSGHAPRGG